jgi:4-aminobutyrate aminotransferase-like enzyme/Ser/Thr protein kinase RdoA (MazF antagonist)
MKKNQGLMKKAVQLAAEHYKLNGRISELPGEIDRNFKFSTAGGENFLLKLSPPETSPDYLDFQLGILEHLAAEPRSFQFPRVLKNRKGQYLSTYEDQQGRPGQARLLTWINGRTWNQVNPRGPRLLQSLGVKCAAVAQALSSYDHPQAHQPHDWDPRRANWTVNHLELFNDRERKLLEFYLALFQERALLLNGLRRSLIHNDANDLNILVSPDSKQPQVTALLDYGDARHTWMVNEAAVALAYVLADRSDPLGAATHFLRGFNSVTALQEDELEALYLLVGLRLVFSVCKSRLNRKLNPGNPYLQISDASSWKLLYRWREISAGLACYAFRLACGRPALPDRPRFDQWAAGQKWKISDLLPVKSSSKLRRIDLSIGSVFLGNFSVYRRPEMFSSEMSALLTTCPGDIPAGGYAEARPFYSTPAFRREGETGPEYRCLHLGLDLWQAAGTEVAAPYPGEIWDWADNNAEKDYGATIILRHQYGPGLYFFTLYGHLARSSLSGLEKGRKLKAGQSFAAMGPWEENGNWPPHLHFQLILDLLENKGDFPGTAFPSSWPLWSALCPDPNLLFKEEALAPPEEINPAALRGKLLGRNLSLSYERPLRILRGEMQYLVSECGRLYLDTVNNVAQVGHEHPRVVAAGQKQMAVLNTNTRYLHDRIIDYAAALLATLPARLEVVFFVNSGSEANELALRLARNHTSERDVIVLEHGYHGNSSACIDISSYKFSGPGGQGCPPCTHVIPLPDTFRGIYRGPDPGNGLKYAAHAGEIIRELKNAGRKPAAFIAESIAGCGGQVVFPAGYLEAVYQQVRQAGGLCIADEVQTGFGRVGEKFWAFELQGVAPDIVTMGKPMGNGHPLGAVACTRELAESFANGMEYFNTFGGNPVSSAIGFEVLRVIKDEGLQENALRVGARLRDGLRELQREWPLLADIRGHGLFLGLELNLEDLEPAPGHCTYLVERMKELGVLMSIDGPDHNVVKIKPPLCFNLENAAELLARLGAVSREDFMKQ